MMSPCWRTIILPLHLSYSRLKNVTFLPLLQRSREWLWGKWLLTWWAYGKFFVCGLLWTTVPRSIITLSVVNGESFFLHCGNKKFCWYNCDIFFKTFSATRCITPYYVSCKDCMPCAVGQTTENKPLYRWGRKKVKLANPISHHVYMSCRTLRCCVCLTLSPLRW